MTDAWANATFADRQGHQRRARSAEGQDAWHTFFDRRNRPGVPGMEGDGNSKSGIYQNLKFPEHLGWYTRADNEQYEELMAAYFYLKKITNDKDKACLLYYNCKNEALEAVKNEYKVSQFISGTITFRDLWDFMWSEFVDESDDEDEDREAEFRRSARKFKERMRTFVRRQERLYRKW